MGVRRTAAPIRSSGQVLQLPEADARLAHVEPLASRLVAVDEPPLGVGVAVDVHEMYRDVALLGRDTRIAQGVSVVRLRISLKGHDVGDHAEVHYLLVAVREVGEDHIPHRGDGLSPLRGQLVQVLTYCGCATLQGSPPLPVGRRASFRLVSVPIQWQFATGGTSPQPLPEGGPIWTLPQEAGETPALPVAAGAPRQDESWDGHIVARKAVTIEEARRLSTPGLLLL